MKAKRFLSTILCMVLTAGITSAVYADTADVDYSTNTGTDAISPIINDTPNAYKFSLPDSGKTYALIDSYQNTKSEKREFFVMTDYSASGGLATDALGQNRYKFAKDSTYTWDSTSENYIWNPTDTNTLAGFINSDTFISKMVDTKVDEYVTVHKYKFEPASEWDKNIKSEVESRYALPALSEISHYKERIGVKAYEYNVSSGAMTTTANSWWLRTPPKTGGNGAMVFHGTNLVPAWQSCDNGWGKTIRPCFYLTEDFFKNVKLDLSDLGNAVIQIVDFDSILSKEQALALGYTEDDWDRLSTEFVNISTQTSNDVNIVCNGGNRIKSGYTLSVTGAQDGDLVQYYCSADGVYGTQIQGAVNEDFMLTNNLENMYVVAIVKKANGDSFVTNKVLVGKNLPTYSGWIKLNLKSENDNADYKLKISGQPGEFTMVGYDKNTKDMTLMSGIAVNSYEETSKIYRDTVNKQIYDETDEKSIAYYINTSGFINSKLITTDYQKYLVKKYWETEHGKDRSDTVSYAAVALPSMTELYSENYSARIGWKIGTGAGEQGGFKTRTPYANGDTQFYYIHNITTDGQGRSTDANSNYYPARVQVNLSANIFKEQRVDMENSGVLALNEIDLPSIITLDEAKVLGYTTAEMILLGFYDTYGTIKSAEAVGKNINVGYIYSNKGDEKNVKMLCCVFDKTGKLLTDIKIEDIFLLENAKDKNESKSIEMSNEILEDSVIKILVWDGVNLLKPMMFDVENN